ncbi:MAG: DUF6326 family protein [Cytophagaceae bacterium]|jgi:hypothetical protein|nr:DUF6326 family protein [Cytophagaceae bacterium]
MTTIENNASGAHPEIDTRVLLSTLWLFATLNYAYCDIFTLFHSEDLKNFIAGKVGDMIINQDFLLTFAIVLEVPILLILLSRVLPFTFNRIANMGAGILMTIVQTGSLFSSGIPTKHYIFFSVIEISVTVFITILAIRWKQESTKLAA